MGLIMTTSRRRRRKYGPTRKRPTVAVGQVWKSSQSRDHKRCVRVESRKGATIALVPVPRKGRCRSVVSERTLRQVYALVGFEVVDQWGATVREGLTFYEAIAARMSLWRKRPGDIAIFGPDGIVAAEPVTRAESLANRKPRRRAA